MAIKVDGEVKEQTGPDIYDRWLENSYELNYYG